GPAELRAHLGDGAALELPQRLEDAELGGGQLGGGCAGHGYDRSKRVTTIVVTVASTIGPVLNWTCRRPHSRVGRAICAICPAPRRTGARPAAAAGTRGRAAGTGTRCSSAGRRRRGSPTPSAPTAVRRAGARTRRAR